MDDDCYLPWNIRAIPEVTRSARLTASEGDPEPLRSGLDRPIGDDDNGWTGNLGAWIRYDFGAPTHVQSLRFVFDSDLNRPEKNQPSSYPRDIEPVAPPQTLVRAFRVAALQADGQWVDVAVVEDNHQRLVKLETDVVATAVRFVPEATWGADQAHLFAWDIDGT